MKITITTLLCVLSVLSYGLTTNNISIFHSKDASISEKNSVNELKNHLSASLGKNIDIINNQDKSSTNIIYVGKTDFAKKNGVDFEKLENQEFIIKSVGKDLILVGGSDQATLYGVLDFLQKFVGVDWFDEWTRIIPKVADITWDDNLYISEKPAFRFRGIYVNPCSDLETRIQFRSRVRDNIYWSEKMPQRILDRWGINIAMGQPANIHTLYYYTKDWDIKKHEECFSLSVDNVRVKPKSPSGPGQICFSSPLARKKMSETLHKFIKSDREKYKQNYPKIYNITMNDSRDVCNCKKCLELKKQYGAYSGVVLDCLNYIGNDIKDKYPDVIIQTIAYLSTEDAPKGIKPVDNVSIQMALSPWANSRFKTMSPITSNKNAKGLATVKKWEKIVNNFDYWNYWILFYESLDCNAGMVNIENIQTNLKFFNDTKSNFVFSECEKPELVTFHPLRLYIGYKLKWNPNQPLEPLLDRFFNGYYSDAAKPMREFYNYTVKRQSEVSVLDAATASSRKYIDKDYFLKAESLLNEAEELLKNNKDFQFNVIRERVPLDIARLNCSFITHPDLPSLDIVKERLKKNWQLVISRYYKGERYIAEATNVMNKFMSKSQKALPKMGLKYPIDDNKFKGKEVFDISYKDFSSLDEMKRYGLILKEDSEAIDKKAMAVETPLRTFTKKQFHNMGYRCGVYNGMNNVFSKSFPKPKNEKYNLLYIGKITLTPSMKLWLHASWFIQQNIGQYYRADKNNTYDIYVSVKRQGPAYIANSKKDNVILVDRILLVESK